MSSLGGNFIIAIAQVLDLLLQIYVYLIIGRAIISWVSPDPYNPIVRFLYSATEPVLKFARKYIPPIGGSLDITPIIVIVVIFFLKQTIIQTLLEFARGF
ncbi:MAG: YggT family protein [Candidatus Dadabacteria bacterium]|nr:YggT family protein [Candidatus Dadabacteria bacterium]NIQ16303.1 YggT family protein [Candidatus Dadabacteria bacterium]